MQLIISRVPIVTAFIECLFAIYILFQVGLGILINRKAKRKRKKFKKVSFALFPIVRSLTCQNSNNYSALILITLCAAMLR